jgi:hypothetical protein
VNVILCQYLLISGEPTFAAFSGMSLTTFDVAAAGGFHAQAATQTLPAGDRGAVKLYSVKVTNTGTRTGDEVVFMFVKPTNLTAQV